MVHIHVDHVTHCYHATADSQAVLSNITLDLTEGRIGVIGHNGSGKSTFVRMLNGLIKPSQGTITVDGIDVRTKAAQVRAFTGFLFTDPDSQIIMPTVGEDVAFGLRKSGLSKDEIASRVDAVLNHYGLLSHKDHPAHLLSGGQKQLLALAAVLITEPRLIIMDEPTTLLDIRNARMIGRIINQLDQTVVLATHHLHLLTDFDRVLVFHHGQIVCDDAPAAAIDFYQKLMDDEPIDDLDGTHDSDGSSSASNSVDEVAR